MWAEVSRTGSITRDQSVAQRIATTHPIWLAAQVGDALYYAAGATAIYESHPLQRQFQDVHVITRHLQGRRAHYALIGCQQLGLPVEDDTSF